MNHTIISDYLIIGCGLAGLYAAHHASKLGTVAVLTKHSLQASNTFWAQGGIAASMDESDSPEIHYDDTIRAGRGLCDHNAVNVLVNDGPMRIKELIADGLIFDKSEKGFALGLEGGHARRRILHIGGNETGKLIVEFLIDKTKASDKINIHENFLVHKLICENNACFGAYAYNWKTKSNYLFLAKVILIASGGSAGIYKRSTNPDSSIGDGIALAYNIGAQIVNMEFIQFHPTAFYSEEGTTFLLSEALRGEGAHLIDTNGNRFMLDYHELAELAPRDIVSKAIYEVLKIKNSDNVFLTLAHLNKNKIKSRFKNLYDKALEYNIDITRDKIPVAPAAHYSVGGIYTNINAETSINRLYAAGEAAHTGVHGANRLASNSLLECIVFGHRAIEDSGKYLDATNAVDRTIYNYYVQSEFNSEYLKLKNKLTEIMNEYVGIIRNGKMLNEALKLIREIDDDWDYRTNEYYSDRLKSLILISSLIIKGAIAREESRGSHIRLDFPNEDKIKYNINQSIKNVLIKEKI